MPTIQRPETDVQRLQALEAASLIGSITAPATLAFSAATLARVNGFLPNFRTQMQERGSALSAQAGSTRVAATAMGKLKLWVTHFIEVFNFGIKREVYDADDRAHYQLPVSQDTVPDLVTDQSIMTWGGRIVSGDAARVAAGGAAMTNPTAADVQTKLTAVTTSQGDQSLLKTAFDAEQEDVAELREEADDIIADVWDEVLFTFRKDSPPSKRRKAREYGVVYALEPGETPSPDDFSIMGTMTDSITGLPISGAAVLVQGPEVIVTTNAQGKYFVPVRPSGSYNGFAHKDGYVDQELGNIVVTAGAITTRDIQMVPGATGTGTVTGKVLIGAANTPATVSAEGTGITTTTDPMGNYTMNNVPSGSRNIRAFETANPANSQTLPANVPAGGSVTVNFSF